MTHIFVCTGLDAGCWNCGDRLLRRGFLGEGKFCDEQCAAEHAELHRRLEIQRHLNLRDMLCDCKICAAFGFPTAEDRAEWDAYMAGAR